MAILTFVLVISICGIASILYVRPSRHQLIPTPGFTGTFTSYLSALRFLKDGHIVIQEGYQRYKHRIFKVALMDRWLLVVSGDQLSAVLRSAPEDVLSMWNAMIDLLQIDYTLGRQPRLNPYHIPLIRNTLTRNLGNVLPYLLDETAHAFGCEIDRKLGPSDEWTAIPAYEAFTQIVCQVSNRVLVGIPVCRNKEYCKLNIQFTSHVMTGAALINLFPEVLKPLVGALYSKISGSQRKMVRLLGPEVERRKLRYTEFGVDYANKPIDMLTWIMESAPPGLEQETSALALRMLNVNFMAVHSASVSFTHAVYNLAAYPLYADILRSEIHMHLGQWKDGHSGWTTEDFERCVKLDSFLKETLRLNGIGALSLPRKAMVPFTFPDGTLVPAGMIVSAASEATHLDSENYTRPEQFDGLRFAFMRETEGDGMEGQGRKVGRYRLTSAGPGFLAFGEGKHICPGRFFASLELKSLFVYMLLHFDVRVEEEGVRPKDEWLSTICMPSRNAKVLFRRRQQLGFGSKDSRGDLTRPPISVTQ